MISADLESLDADRNAKYRESLSSTSFASNEELINISIVEISVNKTIPIEFGSLFQPQMKQSIEAFQDDHLTFTMMEWRSLQSMSLKRHA